MSNLIPATTPNQLVPKCFQWVWLGSDPIPEQDQQWVRSWLHHNPDWHGKVWADSPDTLGWISPQPSSLFVVPLPPLVNRKFYDGIEQWVTGRAAIAARSDIVRYEIIAREGGVYLDTDVEAFQPMGRILDSVRLFYSDEWGPSVGNFMFGATPNHPTLWTVVRELGPHLASKTEPLNAVLATGPHYLGPRMRAHPDCVIFPHMLFNPLCAWDDPAQVERWPEIAIGNHHYSGKWYDREKNVPPTEFLAGGGS